MSAQHGRSRKEQSKNEQQLPILLAHEEELSDQKDVTSNNIDENADGQLSSQSSYKFWNDDDSAAANGGGFKLDKSTPLGRLLNLKTTSDDISLDMDDLLLHPSPEDSKEAKVTFSHSNSNASTTEASKKNTDGKNSNVDVSEVVKCTSNDVHVRKSWLLRSKPRSRLLEPLQPDPDDNKSSRVKSEQIRSGLFSCRTEDEDQEDPFLDADLPEDFKTVNLGIATAVEIISLVVIIAALISSVTIPALRNRTMWDLELWKWEVLGLAVICGRLVSGWMMRVVVFCTMRNFMLRKRLLYFVYGLRRSVQNCLWLGMVLLSWNLLFDELRIGKENRSKPFEYVTMILICLLLATIIWLVKALIVKVLASYFHVSTFFDRIHESLFNQYVIEALSGPPLVEMKRVDEEEARLAEDVQRLLQNAGADITPELKAAVFAKSDVIRKSGEMEKGTTNVKRSHMLSGAIPGKQDDQGIPIDHFHKMNHKNVSAWNMKLLINIVRYGSLTTLDEKLLDTAQENEKQMQIRSECEAKAAAKKIFHNVAKPRSKHIRLEDLMRFMGKDEAEKTLSLFEGASETGKISKSSLKNWVVKAFRERRALSLTLNDTKTAVKRLHQMVNVVVAVVIGLIWLTMLGVTTRKLILVFGSQLVVCAFIFGNTLKNIFEALVFLFIVHPFDVGDRCEIDGKEYVVEEMNILSTVFLRDDNLKVTYMNFMLAMKGIHNFNRSPDMGDAIDFRVHIATPAEKIEQIKQRIMRYIEHKKEHWSLPMIVMRDVEELEMVKFSVWLCHTINFQDMGERFKRRAQLVEEMVKIFKDVDLDYRKFRISKKERNDVQMPGPNSARLPPTWAPPARN
ncbi:unnamed protein product [Rhodiola kirilowii]